MKLIDLIEALRSPETATRLAEKELPGIEYNCVDTYMENEIDLESEIRFFDGENIPPPGMYIQVDGIKYVNLFPLTMAQDMVEDFEKDQGKNFDILVVAKRMLHYRIYDA
jgi:hypothetical protein